MYMATTIDVMSGNHILAGLPLDLANAIAPDLTDVRLRRPELIYDRGGLVEVMYFPTSCLISLVVDLKNGSTVEALAVGKGGFVEAAVFLGRANSTFKAVVQTSGQALRMLTREFHLHLEDPRFRDHIGAAVENSMAAMSQQTACLAFHPVEQRLSRWLLEVRDSTESDEFDITQEFLAQMLGVQRPTATIAMGMLVAAGLISHRRGLVRIEDRQRLEECACECYQTARDRLISQE